MGLKASVTGSVAVTATEGFRLTLTPERVEIPFGSVDMVARFVVGIARDPGHVKTVYLDLLGLVGQWTWSSDQFVAGVDEPIELLVDAAGFPEGLDAPFQIDGYDDLADRPVQVVEE